MNKRIFGFIVFIVVGTLVGYSSLIHHTDPFFDVDNDDFPKNHLPLINPLEATRERSTAPWKIKLLPAIYTTIPGGPDENGFYQIYTYNYIQDVD
jgi:hypothetical protein